ncbi:MAG: hypothetical protein WC748_10545 [Legionellales bacterium]|jgi:hypothetical protein
MIPNIILFYFHRLYLLIIYELSLERRFSAKSAAIVLSSTVILAQDTLTLLGLHMDGLRDQFRQISFERDGVFALIKWPFVAFDYFCLLVYSLISFFWLGCMGLAVIFFVGLYVVIAHCVESAWDFSWPNFSELFRHAWTDAARVVLNLFDDIVLFQPQNQHFHDLTGPQGVHNPELEQMRLAFIRGMQGSQTLLPRKYLRYNPDTETYDQLTPKQIDFEIEDFFSQMKEGLYPELKENNEEDKKDKKDALTWAENKGLLSLTKTVNSILKNTFRKYDGIDVHEALRLLWVSMHDVPNFKANANPIGAVSDLLVGMAQNLRISGCLEGQLERLLDSQALIHNFYPSQENEDLHPVDSAACGQYFMRITKAHAKAALLDFRTDLTIIKECREEDGDYMVNLALWAVIKENVLADVTKECTHPRKGTMTEEARAHIDTYARHFDRSVAVLAICPELSLDEKRSIIEREYLNLEDKSELNAWLDEEKNENQNPIVQQPLVPAFQLLCKGEGYGTFNPSSSDSSFTSNRRVI